MAKANNSSLCPSDLPLLPGTHSVPLRPTFCHRSHRAGQGFCERRGQRTSVSPLLRGTGPRNMMLLRMKRQKSKSQKLNFISETIEQHMILQSCINENDFIFNYWYIYIYFFLKHRLKHKKNILNYIHTPKCALTFCCWTSKNPLKPSFLWSMYFGAGMIWGAIQLICRYTNEVTRAQSLQVICSGHTVS